MPLVDRAKRVLTKKHSAKAAAKLGGRVLMKSMTPLYIGATAKQIYDDTEGDVKKLPGALKTAAMEEVNFAKDIKSLVGYGYEGLARGEHIKAAGDYDKYKKLEKAVDKKYGTVERATKTRRAKRKNLTLEEKKMLARKDF